MKKAIKRTLSVFLSLCVLLSITSAANFSAFADTQMTMTFDQTQARTIFDMINDVRADNPWYWNDDNKTKTYPELNPLQYDYDLEKIAMQRAVEIAVSYSHTRPNGTRCFTAYDENSYYYQTAGENIAYGYVSAQKVHEAWFEEDDDYSGQGHRRNMLNSNFTVVGIAHVKYKGRDFWVEEFASPAKNLTQTTANDDFVDVTVDENRNVTYTAHTHSFSETITKPTCVNKGYTTNTCSVCGYSFVTDYTSATGHSYVGAVVEPTCAQQGYTNCVCANCGDAYTDNYVNALGHSYEIEQATLNKNGAVKCSVCGDVKSTIYSPKAIKLSATSYTYDGKAKTPTVTVKDGKSNTINSKYYTVEYGNSRKNVGKYSVKVTFKGNYSDSKTLYFTINPKGTSVSKLTAGKKAFTVRWNKQKTQTTGYQIQYSTSSKFKNAKTVTVSKNSTTSKTIKKLKAKKKYYVRIRTYKTVGKTKYYSSWSKAKSVKTK